MKIIKSPIRIVILVLLLGIFQSCGMYSFKGISIPDSTETVFIGFFPNKARIVAPVLSQVFTEKLQDKFVKETRLDLLDREGAHLNFTGAITAYNVTPVASGGDDVAGLNRLTIGVQVQYKNTLNQEEWNNNFSRFQDFDKDVNLKDVEDELIEDISQQLVDDIFNKALVNW